MVCRTWLGIERERERSTLLKQQTLITNLLPKLQNSQKSMLNGAYRYFPLHAHGGIYKVYMWKAFHPHLSHPNHITMLGAKLGACGV
jgi:hypothetical protein